MRKLLLGVAMLASVANADSLTDDKHFGHIHSERELFNIYTDMLNELKLDNGINSDNLVYCGEYVRDISIGVLREYGDFNKITYYYFVLRCMERLEIEKIS